jgi:hypothetical protein
LCDPTGGAAVENRTGSAWQAFPEWLQQYLSVNGRLSLITLLAFPAFQSRSRS